MEAEEAKKCLVGEERGKREHWVSVADTAGSWVVEKGKDTTRRMRLGVLQIKSNAI
jgi:hypothetical protein